MVEVTRETLVRKIRETKGKFFTVVFRKRSDGTLRTLNGRIGVAKYVKGTGKSFSASCRLITVWDAKVPDKETAYRCFGEESIISAKIGGESYEVKD